MSNTDKWSFLCSDVKNPLGKIPEDQAIEESINKRSKIPGGIVEKNQSRNPEALGQWIDTRPDR